MTLTLAQIMASADIDPAATLVIRHAYVREHDDGSVGIHGDSTTAEILAYTRVQSASTRTFPANPPSTWIVFLPEGGDRARLWAVLTNHGEVAHDGQLRTFEGWVMRGGSIIDATIIAAPSSTKNATGTRDPAMHQTKKGNQWFFGMKAHIGADAGTGYVHTVTATAANVHDLDEAVHLVRADDEVVYADAGYQGAAKRPEIAGDEDLSRITWKIAPRKGVLKTMPEHDRAVASRQASVRAKVEHPFLIVKRDFAFTKTRYRGIAKNLNHLNVLFASANWLMRARAVALMG
jgi:IS5 family transposase